MKILILHNDTLPGKIVDEITSENLKNEYVAKIIRPSISDKRTFDKFVSDQIDTLFSVDPYDLVVLSYNITGENYADYSGVRMGMHLRLTEKTKYIPLLFIGPDKPAEIAKLSELGSLLFTPEVFVSNLNTIYALDNFVEITVKPVIKDDNEIKCQENYSKFLRRVKIQDVENFGSHAISNIWAIKRWQDMMFDDQFNSEITDDPRRSQLNFKYVNQVAQIRNRRQCFKKSQQKCSDTIDGVEGKKIVYVDDEVDFGWGKLLKRVFDDSGAIPAFWHPCNNKDRITVTDSILSFIKNNNDADCYIIDLRLAEEDTNEQDYTKLTGHTISRYIMELNKANQIIIFTASNKIWNLKEEIESIGVLGYALKESPSMNLDRAGSKKLFSDFAKLITNACARSQLKKLVTFQNKLKKFDQILKSKNQSVDLTGLYNSIDLLLLDKNFFIGGSTNFGKKSSTREILKTVILNLCVFVETYMTERFRINHSEKHQVRFSNADNAHYAVKEVSRKDTKSLEDKCISHEILGHLFTRKVVVDSMERLEVIISKDKLETSPDGCKFLCKNTLLPKKNDLSLMLSAFYAFYSSDKDLINLLVKFKDVRNSCIAHNGGDINISYVEINDYFLILINTILETDYKEDWGNL